MKKVLFVSYGGGHINLLSLVAKALERHSEIEFKLLALTTAYKVAAALLPNHTTRLIDYAHLFEDNRLAIENYGRALLKENFNPNSGISEQETIWYLGLSMLDLIQQYGEELALKLYGKNKRQVFLPINTIKKILQYENADVVVSTTSPRFEQASLIAGNQLGIKTIEILDLFGELYPLPEAKHIVCMDKSVSDSLKNQGLIDREYYHYGQPIIEESCKLISKLNRKLLKSRLRLNKKIVLLYATQYPGIYDDNFCRIGFPGYEIINNHVFAILKKLHEKFSIDILLRIHPNEDIENYQPWLDRNSFVKFINTELNAQESIAVCDVLLTQASTLGVEAMAAGKPVFTFRYHLDKTYPLPRAAEKPFIHARGFNDLENKLFDFVQNNSLQCPSKEIKFLPMNSVENIVKLIKA